jgi:hypothetical protein
VTTLSSLHIIRNRAAEFLGSDALPFAEVMDRLVADGVILGPTPADRVIEALQFDPRFVELADERWAHVPSLLHGTTWSLPLDSAVAGAQLLPCTPDLELFSWWAIEDPIRLADGSGALEVVQLDDGRDAFVGPGGWLAGGAGTTLLVHVVEGEVTLEHVDHPPVATSAQVGAVRQAFAREAETVDAGSGLLDEQPHELTTAMLEDLLAGALVVDRGAFVDAPVPPVDALLAAAGLERVETTVAELGCDWNALNRSRRRTRLALIHDLDDQESEALELLLRIAGAIGDGPAGTLGSPDAASSIALASAMYLSEASLAHAFVGEMLGADSAPEVTARFARLVLEHLDADDIGAEVLAVGVRWVLARALDHLGESIAAEAELESAVAIDPDFPLVLVSLAGFASDRGDAVRALSLLERADVDDDDPLHVEVAGYALQRPRPAAGRNQLCPCGSGRKYKVCHLGQERHALVDRAPWLYRKARRYLHDGPQRPFGADLAGVAATASGRMGLSLELLESELIDDLALCEGGVMESFLAERDAFLPDDEAMLAASWSTVPRSLFEIEWSAGDELALRDLRTGDHLVVSNVNEGGQSVTGSLLLGRPLPVLDTWRAFAGFVPVPDSMRSEVLEALDDPDPFGLAELVGRTFAPPEMRNTDDEPLVFHELRFTVPDPSRAAAALRASELQDDGDGFHTLVRDTAGQRRTLIMSAQLTGADLVVTVNSDQRAEEARALVARVLPDAVLVDDDVRSVAEAMHDFGADERSAAAPDLDDAPTAALLDELMQEQERRWVEEPVPALDGMTPRQAAADPIGRVELERLLRTFETRGGGNAHTFDVSRLRALLDLR